MQITETCCSNTIVLEDCLFTEVLPPRGLGTIHLRRRQIFMIFDPYPPPVGSCLLLSVGKFGQIFIPPPLKNADVLNRWSLYMLFKAQVL